MGPKAVGWALALAMALVALVAILAYHAYRGPAKEAFVDVGPDAPINFKPCRVYYTPDRTRCDAGAFDLPRVAYEARLKELQAKTPASAADSAAIADLQLTLAEMDALGATTCAVTLPGPWTRATPDAEETIYDTYPQPLQCFVPVDDDTAYGDLADPGAKVAPTEGTTFAFHANDAPLAPAMTAFRRVEFGDLSKKAFADGFHCRLPAVAAARKADPRYADLDGAAAGWTAALTFSVLPLGSTRLQLTAVTHAAGGDRLKAALEAFYDESLDESQAAFARLLWVPRLETAAQATRLARDACGQPYVAQAYDDKCHVGSVTELKRFAAQPRPAVYGTSATIRAELNTFLQDLRQANSDLRDARALRDKKRGRYDLTVDVLRLMLAAWELQHSAALPQLVNDANSRAPASPYASRPANLAKPTQLASPTDLSLPAPLPLVDGALVNDGPPPPTERPLPQVPVPHFEVVSYATGGTPWPLLTNKNEIYSTAPAMCPAGYHVVAVRLGVANSNITTGDATVITMKSQINANVLCYNPTTRDTITQSSDARLTGPTWTPRTSQ